MITVRRIERKELGRFLRLPFSLYRGDPNWVPPLFSEMKGMLDPEKNAFLKNGEHAFFMAFRDGKAVARVLAGLNYPVTKKTGIPNGFFSLFEAQDEESGAAVLDAACRYCKSLGAVKIVGPYSPTDGEEGRALLVEGFGFPPVIYTAYNPPWYKDLIESCGFTRHAKDLLAFLIEADTMPIEKFRRVVAVSEKRGGFSARRIDFSDLESELRDIEKIISESAVENWDSIPSWEQIEQTADAMKSLADPDFIYIVRTDEGRPVAFVVAIPDYNQALIHMKGRLFPFGFVKFLYWRKRIKGIRILMQFCVKDYEGKGAVSSAYLKIMEKAREKGYLWGEAGTIGEENVRSWRAVVGAGGRPYRKYRWYEKAL